MVSLPEVDHRNEANGVEVRPETPDVSEIQKSGVAASVPPTQIVTGGPLGQPADGGQKTTGSVDPNTVVVPNSYAALLRKARGKVVDAATWLAVFWLRLIKKALLLGKKVVYRQ